MLKHVNDAQLRAARGLLAWSVNDLARTSGVSPSEIVLFEMDGAAVDPQLLDQLVSSLEAAGVLFLDNRAVSEGGPGVRLKRQGPLDEGLHLNELTSDNDG